MPEKKFYSIKAMAETDTAEIFIYEQIGEDWWTGEGVTAKNFCKEVAALNVRQIDLHINSPGGSVFDGQAIYNALKRHPACVTTYVDGIAASIASVIALAGDTVIMAPNSLYMIHNPWGLAQGSADEMRKYADLLDKVRDTIVSVYREKCGLSDEGIIALMDAETWMSAEEAQAFGFVDEIGTELKLAALAGFDFKAMGFKKAPAISASITSAPAEKPQTAPQAEIKEAPMPNVAVGTPAAGERNHQSEAAEIAAMCAQNHCADRAAGFIQAGFTPDQVGRQILDLHASGALATPAAEAPALIDMGKQAKNYSYQKALVAAIDIREGRAASGFEYEIHQDIAKRLPQNYQAKGGILMPMRVQNTALTTGGSGTGSEVVFTEYGELIDILRKVSVLTRMGAKTLTDLRGPITFPKLTGSHTAHWVGENPGSDVGGSNVTFGTMTMSPKTLQATGAVSRQLLVQSTPDVEGIVRTDIGMVHALAWDQSGIHADGTANDPTGIYAAAGINAVAMGGVPTFGKLVDMETEINKDNALISNMGFVTTSGMAGKMRQTLESATAGARWIWDGNAMEGIMAGYKAMSSNQIKANLGTGTDEHGLILGNWADMLIGMWAGIELLVDPYTLVQQGLIQITSFQMVDIGIRRPESFCKATGAKIA
ncbi:phage major capsid protein [Trichlorobacter lovleyi]|uniref:head maturation protease, ClpP-related n=1 Tax=Trichlorobacter lovleyi TaxID=313985 RepID=UPI0022408A29|nr:head maturation protease, ClpP-related [Trichlorobacter lovleyi]QOX78739.1 phage major capsid protein [Trichlorobacter lovleyi]